MCTYEAYEIVNAITNVVSAVVHVQSARQEKAEYEYNVRLYTSKAEKMEAKATTELQSGIEKARRQRLNAILSASEQKAEIAAGNLGVSSSMSLNIVDDEILNGELNALTTLKTAEQKHSDYIDKANEYYANAQLSATKAKNVFWDSAKDYTKKNLISTVKSMKKGKQ